MKVRTAKKKTGKNLQLKKNEKRGDVTKKKKIDIATTPH